MGNARSESFEKRTDGQETRRTQCEVFYRAAPVLVPWRNVAIPSERLDAPWELEIMGARALVVKQGIWLCAAS